ncbi:hypothetical protein UlMin_034975 [Ulmus minor]
MNQTLSNPFKSPNAAEPLASMLQESIHRFLADYRNGVTNFSCFSSIFSRLLYQLPDPPLEIVWFYSAVTFHSTNFTAQDHSARVSAVKDLFQLLVSCSASCSSIKRIAVLGPVVYELYNLGFDKEDLEGEIESLLEGIYSYISMCCGNGVELGDGDDLLGSSFLDVIRVWVVDRIGVGDGLRAFFPIASDDVRAGITGCGVGYLAGVVMVEAFLLKLCFKFRLELSRARLESDLRNWAVQAINGFRYFYFFDGLLRMLLEPVLPVTKLLSSKDDNLLHEVLYDSVIMVEEHSFLNPHVGLQLPDECLKKLAVTWLLVTDNAIRNNEDQTKVISYTNALSESCLLSQLIKWVMDQSCMKGTIFRPNISTPVALIKWMLLVEDQGLQIFDSYDYKVRARAVICKSRVECVLPVTNPDGKNMEGSDLEMADSTDTVSVAADGMIDSTANGMRKRKGMIDGEELQVKFFKYCQKSVRELLGNDDGLSSESEVDNPVPDGDTEDMQH